MWYKAILQSANCPGADKPDGFETGSDVLNWAVVVAPGASGLTLRGGYPLQTVTLVSGLNMGQFTGLEVGSQSMELWQGQTMILVAAYGRCVSASCPDGTYNMNYQVVPLSTANPGAAPCLPEIGPGGIFTQTCTGKLNF